MGSLVRSAAVLAFAGIALAVPAPADDTCLAAVTGKGSPAESVRKEHCSGFLKTTITSPPVTTTVFGVASTWQSWAPDDSACANDVPEWASGCDKDKYRSACKKWGVTETTITAPPTTTTVYVTGPSNGQPGGKPANPDQGKPSNGKPGDCSPYTITITQDPSKPTGGPKPDAKCLTDGKATEFVNAFKDLLEHTSYNGTQGAPGSGYHFNVSAKYLAEDFQDYSDSINYMAGFPLGSVTFNGRKAFDYGQGVLQPELKVETKFVSHNCKEITWKWVATTQTRASVMGINHMILNDDLTQIKVNHAEFNNANWINSFGIPGVNCKLPQQTTPTKF